MWSVNQTLKSGHAAIAFCVLLSACSGSTGPGGPAGASGGTSGSTPPPVLVTATNVGTATQITATITGVTIAPAPAAATPVVKFQLLNQVGAPLSGLTAGQVSFAVAKLVPAGTQLAAVPPQTATPVPLVSSQWQSYIYLAANPAPATIPPALPVTGTTPEPQATIEAGSAGAFVDNGDGTYQYTFATDISKDPAVTYDATLTHRVAFEIRGVADASGAAIAANSPVYTFQPSSGGTTGITQYDIVADQTCKNCHQVLAWHGGARTEIKYCVMCHNPSSIDPSSGNSLDFKVMFHKIHMGKDLPSVTGNGIAQHDYYIFGFRNSINDYSTVAYPQGDASANNTNVSGTGQRFCATCHDVSNPLTPQTGNFSTMPSAAACGSCHDNVNFATGVGHGTGIVATDSECATCHGPGSNINSGALQVVAAHQTPVDAAIAKFKYTVLSVTNTAPGQIPVATIKVTDPTNNDAPYDITTAGGPFLPTSARLNLDLAWNTIDVNNIGSGTATGPGAGSPSQPIVLNFLKPVGATVTHNADGSFSLPAPIAIPLSATGSGVASLEGRPVVSLANISGLADTIPTGTTAISLGVKGAELTYAITDITPAPRSAIVDIAKCNVCHRVLTLHGQNRTDNINLCASCHNPNATDAVVHIATSGPCTVGTPDNPIDFKVMIHQIHRSGNTLAYPNGVTICGNGGNATTFNVLYPSSSNSSLANCTACHNAGTYYPVDPNVIQGTTIHAGNRQILTDDVVVSANSAVCSSCHTDPTAAAHMTQNGGNFEATKTATGALDPLSTETCSICHGPGGTADVAVVHKLASYQ